MPPLPFPVRRALRKVAETSGRTSRIAFGVCAALLLFKSLWLLGLTFDPLHLWPRFGETATLVFSRSFFQPVFFVTPLFAVLSLGLLFPGRWRTWVLALSSLVFSLLLLVDALYMRSFHAMPSLHLLHQSSNLDRLGSSIASIFHVGDLAFVFDLPFLAVFLFHPRFFAPRSSSPRLFLWIFSFCLTLLVAIGPFYRLVERHFMEDRVGPLIDPWDPRKTLRHLGPFAYHGVSAWQYFGEKGDLRLAPEERERIRAWLDAKRENLPPGPLHGAARGRNLLVLQVESLEDFVIGHDIEGQPITPEINRLLPRSLRFTRFHEQVSGGMSSDADLLLNTSVHPILEGSTFFRFPFTFYPSLPRLLERHGYSTAVYHPDNGSFWNWMPALRSIGFQECHDASSYDLSDSFGLGISDEALLRQVGERILRQKCPFFAFVVTLSMHVPFVLPTKHRSLRLSAEQNASPTGRYLQATRYTDLQIGRLLARLESSGVLRDTLVVIYGDHESIHRYYPDEAFSFLPQEPWMVNERRVPLVIHGSDFSGRLLPVTGGQIDLYPTIADLLGIPREEWDGVVMGRSLVNTERDYALLQGGRIAGTESDETLLLRIRRTPAIGDLIIRGDFFRTSTEGLGR